MRMSKILNPYFYQHYTSITNLLKENYVDQDSTPTLHGSFIHAKYILYHTTIFTCIKKGFV